MKLQVDFKRVIGYFNLNSERGLFVNWSRDWKVALVCSFMLLVIVFAVDASTLLSVKDKIEAPVESGSKDKEVRINDALLQKALGDISARKEIFNKNFILVAPSSSSTPIR